MSCGCWAPGTPPCRPVRDGDPDEIRAATYRLGGALAERGILTQLWPAGLSVCTNLYVFVGRITGTYRWLEDCVPQEYPIGEVERAADQIVAWYRHLEATQQTVAWPAIVVDPLP